jgi:hypothetical protein
MGLEQDGIASVIEEAEHYANASATRQLQVYAKPHFAFVTLPSLGLLAQPPAHMHSSHEPRPSYMQIETLIREACLFIERIARSMWNGANTPEQFPSECSSAHVDSWLQILDACATQVR